jgi:adenylate cyclase class 2
VTGGGSSSVETEIKIPVADLAAVRGRLLDAGAERISMPHLEQNILFDDPGGAFSSSGCALRLRLAGGAAIVTFKGPVQARGVVKSREEIETRVDDAGVVEEIFRRLGFVRRFRYEKRREEFKFLACEIALDETPIGNFVEVEGEADPIRDAVARLSLSESDAVLHSYAGLYRRERERNPSLPPDMLFSR